jgi:ElaB/YqjD/DUF883 family membrane-anchored ribosome-binding protein
MEARVSTPLMEARSLPADRLVTDFKEVFNDAKSIARQRAKAADELVRARPYQTMGVVLGLGVLIGVLAGRRWHS